MKNQTNQMNEKSFHIMYNEHAEKYLLGKKLIIC